MFSAPINHTFDTSSARIMQKADFSPFGGWGDLPRPPMLLTVALNVKQRSESDSAPQKTILWTPQVPESCYKLIFPQWGGWGGLPRPPMLFPVALNVKQRSESGSAPQKSILWTPQVPKSC